METSLTTPINPATLPDAAGNYTHGTLVAGVRRAVFVSGQVPWSRQGSVPGDFDSQCRLTWRNVLAVLAEAGMGIQNLAKVTTYLSDRRYREANSRIRQEVLGDHRPALTIIITDIYSEDWLLEIEGIAVE
ncbi:RidA family protein [Nonomuraea rubra]